MVERKMNYGYNVAKLVDRDTLYDYLVVDQIPLVEAMVYHLVHDLKKEKTDVADMLGLSISRISHAYNSAVKRF